MNNRNIIFNFKSKNVLVVGGSRGIGKEVCKQFINCGANVYNASRSKCLLVGVKNIKCDISKGDDIKSLFKQINDLDFCINVAGTNLCEKIENINSEEWDRVLNINLKSFYMICKSAIQIMKKKNGGRIVNVSSIAGRSKSVVSGVHYTSSKYGVIGLTRSLATELGKEGITVNCICPGPITTDMTSEIPEDHKEIYSRRRVPLKRYGDPEEVAHATLSLCLPASS